MLANRARTLLAVAAACGVLVALWFVTREVGDTRSQMQRSTHATSKPHEAPSIATGSSAAPITGPALVVKVRAEGKPVVAAEVRLDDDATALTDDDGIARFARPAPDSYELTARAPGFAMVTQYTRVDPGEGDIVVEIALVRGAPLSGIVVDESGKRVAGAKVQVSRLGGADEDDPAYAVADASGAWELDVVGGRYVVNARADGFGPTVAQPIELDGKTARRDVVVRVTAGGVLFGKVVDVDGKPVAGVKVGAQQEARIDSWDATTDAQGRYEIRGLPEGSYMVMRWVGRAGYPDYHATIVAGQRTEQDLVVDDDRIEGIVVDTKGAPLAGIWVGEDYEDVTTDAHGRFAIVLHEGRSHSLRARRDKAELTRSPAIEIEGSAKDVKFVLEDGAVVTGRVLLDGKPVTDYAIAIAPARDEDTLAMEGRTLHAADGKFTIREVTPGQWRMVIAAEGCDVAFTEPKQVAPGKSIDFGDIALTRGRRITGHVRDANGEPVAGARVILNDEPSRWDSPLRARLEAKAETISDASGAFVFDGISRRTLYSKPVVRAKHPAYGFVTKGLEGDSIDLAFEQAMGGIDGVIENFVGDETFFAAGDQIAAVNRAGEFHFDGLPAGTYRIAESMESHHRRIKPVTVTVEAGRRTKVRVHVDMQTVALRVRVVGDCDEVVRFTTQDQSSSGVAGELACEKRVATLPFVAPGTYRACDWKTRCATIVVPPSPLVQSIELQLRSEDQSPQAAAPPW